MNNVHDPVYVGLPDFDEPTLLICGSGSGLSQLADFIESRRTLDAGSTANTEAPVILVNLQLMLSTIKGTKSHLSTQTNNVISWSIAVDDAQPIAARLRALAASECPAHLYIDVASVDGLQILVSKDEYDPTTIFTI